MRSVVTQRLPVTQKPHPVAAMAAVRPALKVVISDYRNRQPFKFYLIFSLSVTEPPALFRINDCRLSFPDVTGSP